MGSTAALVVTYVNSMIKTRIFNGGNTLRHDNFAITELLMRDFTYPLEAIPGHLTLDHELQRPGIYG